MRGGWWAAGAGAAAWAAYAWGAQCALARGRLAARAGGETPGRAHVRRRARPGGDAAAPAAPGRARRPGHVLPDRRARRAAPGRGAGDRRRAATRSATTPGVTGTRGSFPRRAAAREITEGARILGDILGRPPRLYRPPWGIVNARGPGDGAPARAGRRSSGPSSTRGSGPRSPAAQLRHVADRLHDGAIVDLHDAPGLPGAPERLLAMLPGLLDVLRTPGRTPPSRWASFSPVRGAPAEAGGPRRIPAPRAFLPARAPGCPRKFLGWPPPAP